MNETIITIGVIEESKKRNTFKLLKNLLTGLSFKVSYENIKENIIIFNQNNKIIIIIDIGPDIINFIDYIGLDFTLLIHTFLKSDDNKNSLRNIIHRTKKIIINCDEERWIDLLEENKESIVISYGFNSRATINPSSYNIHDLIKANICFQRKIFSLSGEKIDPFEIPIKINSIHKQDLYSVMGVLAIGLIVGGDKFLKKDIINFQI